MKTAILLIVIALFLAFEIWMLIDAIRNPNLKKEERILWIVGMIFIHPFVGIAYFFFKRSALTQ